VLFNKPLYWTKKAQKDLSKIEEYIAQDKPAAAAKMVLKIVQATEGIRAFPWIYEAVDVQRPQYRQMIKKPFVVLYEVTDREIVILRVVHTSTRWK
jgi:addiction module RelE/StbE family toxin